MLKLFFILSLLGIFNCKLEYTNASFTIDKLDEVISCDEKYMTVFNILGQTEGIEIGLSFEFLEYSSMPIKCTFVELTRAECKIDSFYSEMQNQGAYLLDTAPVFYEFIIIGWDNIKGSHIPLPSECKLEGKELLTYITDNKYNITSECVGKIRKITIPIKEDDSKTFLSTTSENVVLYPEKPKSSNLKCELGLREENITSSIYYDLVCDMDFSENFKIGNNIYIRNENNQPYKLSSSFKEKYFSYCSSFHIKMGISLFIILLILF